MDGNSDMRMMRQATIQTWIDQAQAERTRRNREWFVVALVGVLGLVAVIAPAVFK